MTSQAKRAGTEWERRVVDYLASNGVPHAERRAPHGASDRGDVAGLPGVVIEAKAGREIALGTWLSETYAEVANADAEHGLLLVKRRNRPAARGYAVMELWDAVRLLRQAGWGDPLEETT
jgi:hypothetical protein